MRTARISANFSDIADLGRVAGWDLGFRQLDAGEQRIPAKLVSDGRLTIIRMEFNRRFHQLGTPPPGSVAFGVPVDGMRDWFGRPYAEQAILPFNQPNGVDGVSAAGFRAFTVTTNEASIQEVRQSFGIPLPEQLVEPTSDAVIPNGPAAQVFRSSIDQVVRNDTQPLSQEIVDELMVSLLYAGLSDSAILDKSTPASRSRALRRALTHIAETAGDAITVRELCVASGAALRTLDRAFKDRFDIGPKAYLQRTRLSKVRAELVARVPGTKIADVANAWGFWHMGQFARDYRNMFGELPSETLSRDR